MPCSIGGVKVDKNLGVPWNDNVREQALRFIRFQFYAVAIEIEALTIFPNTNFQRAILLRGSPPFFHLVVAVRIVYWSKQK